LNSHRRDALWTTEHYLNVELVSGSQTHPCVVHGTIRGSQPVGDEAIQPVFGDWYLAVDPSARQLPDPWIEKLANPV